MVAGQLFASITALIGIDLEALPTGRITAKGNGAALTVHYALKR